MWQCVLCRNCLPFLIKRTVEWVSFSLAFMIKRSRAARRREKKKQEREKKRRGQMEGEEGREVRRRSLLAYSHFSPHHSHWIFSRTWTISQAPSSLWCASFKTRGLKWPFPSASFKAICLPLFHMDLCWFVYLVSSLLSLLTLKPRNQRDD